MGLAPEAPAVLRVALDEIVEDGVRRPFVEALLDQPSDDDVLKGVEPPLAVRPAGILRDDEVQQDPSDVVAPRPPLGLQPLAIGALPFALLRIALPDRLPHILSRLHHPPRLAVSSYLASPARSTPQAQTPSRAESDFSRVVTQPQRPATLVHGPESHQRKSR